MAEILGSTNLHTEVIHRYGFDYQITIDIIKEFSRYDRKESVNYYKEFYVLSINKIVKRNKWLRWLLDGKKILLYTTKFDSNENLNKNKLLEFALNHISKIESSLYS